MTGAQLALAHSQLGQYKERYSTRLKAKNLLYIKQILFILARFVTTVLVIFITLGRFIKVLGGKPGRDPEEVGEVGEETRLVGVGEFLATTEVFNLNLIKLIRWRP